MFVAGDTSATLRSRRDAANLKPWPTIQKSRLMMHAQPDTEGGDQGFRSCHLQTHNPSAGLSVRWDPRQHTGHSSPVTPGLSGSFFSILIWNCPRCGPMDDTGLTFLRLSHTSPHLPFSHQCSLKRVIHSHVSSAFIAPNKHCSGHTTVFMPCTWGEAGKFGTGWAEPSSLGRAGCPDTATD